MNDVRENCRRVMDRIHAAAARSGRSGESIRLVAVTKTVSTENIRTAVEAGITHIGENRLQEALPKREALRDLPLTWHFIGHLQTNKAKKVLENFDWIQSLDRLELAEKLDQHAERRFPVLIEVKLYEEPTKSGIRPDKLPGFLPRLKELQKLNVRGFMAVPPYSSQAEDSRPFFRKVKELTDHFGLPEISIGMSHDFEVAIEEGATMVRIGTALFGERPKP